LNRYDHSGRVALVTGGASGIGAATAAALREAGATVVVLDQRTGGVDGPSIQADVSNSSEIIAALERVEDEHGGLDVLVHAAGIGGPWKSGLELTDAEWRRIMDVNAAGTFYLCRAAMPRMIERGYGRIVLLSSIAGKNGHPLLPAYAASKAAVIALAKSFARDGVTSNVLVNVVAPAVIDTPLATVESEHMLDFMVSKVPMGRMGTAAEAAALIAWLSSEDCSFSTGAVYDLSGGAAVY